MKNGFPIFIVHLGNSFYLQYVLNQMAHFNPDSDIILIGNEANKYCEKYGIKHVMYDQYAEKSQEFAHYYVHAEKHFSREMMLLCFSRLMYVEEYLIKNNIRTPFFFCDSDILVYDDLTKHAKEYLIEYDFSLHGDHGPGCNYFRNASVLSKMVDNIFEYYTNEEKLKYMLECERTDSDCGIPEGRFFIGGVNEMSFFGMLAADESIRNYDLLQIVDEISFDSHIAKTSDDRFEMCKRLKKISFINGQPFCYSKNNNDKIRLIMLHMQGFYKMYMYRYYTGDSSKVDPVFKARLRLVYQLIRRRVAKLLRH